MGVGLTSAALASIVALTVAIAILFRRPRRDLYIYFSAFTFSLFLWHAASLVSIFTGTVIGLVQSIAALFIPPTTVLFFRELLRFELKITRWLMPATFVGSGLLLLVTFTPWGETIAFRALVVAYTAAVVVLVGRALYDRMKNARSESDRKRLRYLLWGGLITSILAAGGLVPGVGVLASAGHLAVTFYIYFLYQSIIARRLIDLVELLSKGAVLGMLTLVLATVYALLVLWVGADEQGLWLFNTLVASFVILILYDQVRPWVETTTARVFFRQQHELRQAMRRLLRLLRTTIGLEEMRNRVLDALHASGRAPNAGIYLAADGELTWALFGYRGAKPPEIVSVGQHPSLLQELRRERRPILFEHLQHRVDERPATLTDGDPTATREIERLEEAMSAMRAMHAGVLIPMLSGERIVGILCTGLDTGGDPYSAEELAALLSVAEACAVVVENSQEYERLRERDRLVAIGEMAAGMAHEIRNPLGAIRGAVQCLDPTHMPPDNAEFLDVIIEEVDRLNGVVEQFLQYAKPYRGNPVPTDVNDVVHATLRLLGNEAVPAGVRISHHLADKLPHVAVDPEQLKQVLINLVLNAVQAVGTAGEVSIHTSESSDHSGDFTAEVERGHMAQRVLIRVRDTGHGIAAEDLPRIFVPFFTTKDHGTGLGLAISQRIIQNAGGRIEVQSRVGEGTTFTVRLPAPRSSSASSGTERKGNIAGTHAAAH
jgi:two-component system, NtrC family, sensor histidine kinase HydH